MAGQALMATVFSVFRTRWRSLDCTHPSQALKSSSLLADTSICTTRWHQEWSSGSHAYHRTLRHSSICSASSLVVWDLVVSAGCHGDLAHWLAPECMIHTDRDVALPHKHVFTNTGHHKHDIRLGSAHFVGTQVRSQKLSLVRSLCLRLRQRPGRSWQHVAEL